MNVELARIQFAFTSVVIIFLPLVLGCQAWTYYVFRQRVSRQEFLPAPQPSTLPGAGHPAATPEATSPPSRHGT